VRGGREIFAGLDFTADAGEPLTVVGANGAGKTSLLRLIAGLIVPAGGSITFAGGHDDLSPAEQAHYLGHRDALKSALSVIENLAFWRAAGQRRRLSIARLLAVKRPIWLLDEPTSSLDASGQAMMADLMRDHLAGGGIIVAATHLPLGIAARELRIGERVS
jgi:heme exporter protein A